MDTSKKLAQVRKSCNVLEIIFKIFKILCCVGAGICLVASIVFGILGNKVVKFDNGTGEYYSSAKINLHIFDNDIISYENGKLDGPFASILERALEDSIQDELGINGKVNLEGVFEGEYGENAVDLLNSFVKIGLFLGLLFAAVMCGIAAVIWWLIEGIFKEIKESESPFTESILKKLRIVFIVVSIFAFLMSGFWAGAITALLCWAVYCIIDYGYALQSEVDETL